MRIHGTTHERPADRFTREQSHLIATTGQPGFRLEASQPRLVAEDYLVSFETNRYSVPFTLIGQTVEVARRRGRLHIAHRGSVVAEQELPETSAPHPARAWPGRHRPDRPPDRLALPTARGRAALPVKASVWSEDAIHRPLGAEIPALVEQGGVDLARRQVHEARRARRHVDGASGMDDVAGALCGRRSRRHSGGVCARASGRRAPRFIPSLPRRQCEHAR